MTEPELPLAADKPPVQTETVEQAEDRVFDALIGKEEAPKAAEPVAEKKEQPEEEAEDGASGEDADESASESDLEKAITSLRRAKVPQTVLKKMTQREIVALSKDMADRQAEVDNAFRELGELRKAKQQFESRKESAAEPTEQPESDDLDKQLGELFDPDTGKALKALTKRAIDAETKALKAELASMSSLVERTLTKEIRGDLRERFPEVDEVDKWQKVQDKAATLAKTGDYAGLDDPMRAVFEDAAAIVLKQKPTSTPKPDSSRAKANGQPASKSKQVPPKALTPEERETAALDALLDGKGRDAARAAYGG